jgi:uncharacterized protein (DUF1015 family)
MSIFKPFPGLRPKPELAAKVAAPPYDVLSSEEASKLAEGNPYTFLHVTKSEIDLPANVDHYDPLVYETASNNLQKMIRDNVISKDPKPCYYFYRQVMNGRAQTGIVGVASVDDYVNGTIKIHEQTREDKELDRINHIKGCAAQTGPVFLTYHDQTSLNTIVDSWTKSHQPTCDFVSHDGVRHVLWVVDNDSSIQQIEAAFGKTPAFYVADGHHRSAAAVKVCQERRAKGQKDPAAPHNFFLAVAFPASELHIMDYNRVVKDLVGMSEAAFIEKISPDFSCEKLSAAGPYKPQTSHEFGMYLGSSWYKLTARPHIVNQNDPIECLDVYILQRYLLDPILGIKNPRTDKRIDFVGGIRGLGELEKKVCDQKGGVAFSMYPTTINELMNVADANLLMPPKSTWFEPKLRCGMVTHQINSSN